MEFRNIGAGNIGIDADFARRLNEVTYSKLSMASGGGAGYLCWGKNSWVNERKHGVPGINLGLRALIFGGNDWN